MVFFNLSKICDIRKLDIDEAVEEESCMLCSHPGRSAMTMDILVHPDFAHRPNLFWHCIRNFIECFPMNEL